MLLMNNHVNVGVVINKDKIIVDVRMDIILLLKVHLVY